MTHRDVMFQMVTGDPGLHGALAVQLVAVDLYQEPGSAITQRLLMVAPLALALIPRIRRVMPKVVLWVSYHSKIL